MITRSKLIDFKIKDAHLYCNRETGKMLKKSELKEDEEGDYFEFPNTILEKVVTSPEEDGIQDTQEMHTCIEILLLSGATITEYAKRYCGWNLDDEIYCKAVREFQLELCDVDSDQRKERFIENNIAQTIIDNDCDADFVHNLFKDSCCTSWSEKTEKNYKKHFVVGDGTTYYRPSGE